jgi:Fur family transcriptional regulator, ferric uptake regulator
MTAHSSVPDQSSTKPWLLSVLRRAGHRLTGPRRAVAELISERQGHFTAAELLDELRARRSRVGRATVFRSLDLLIDLDALERLDLPSGEHAYVACEPLRQHHHHVVCSVCGRSTEVGDCGMQAVATEAGRRTGYRIEEHRLELYGSCPTCQRRIS